MAALEQHPPPQPSQQAVDLLVSVGQQQKYLDANGLLPPAGHPGALDAFQVCNYIKRNVSSQHQYIRFASHLRGMLYEDMHLYLCCWTQQYT